MPDHRCPLCGCPVRVRTDGEGTSCYEPDETVAVEAIQEALMVIKWREAGQQVYGSLGPILRRGLGEG